MTPEAQRIAIAEACGAEWVSSGWGCKFLRFLGVGIQGVGLDENDPRCSDFLEGIPDYLNDLNAMHEAEENLTPAQALKCHDELVGLCGGETPFATFANATQHAEAFLRTLNLWNS